MRYVIFTNTPAHVHLYRNAVSRLQSRGHEVLVLGRDYGCTVDLLEWYDLPHEVYGGCDTTMFSLFRKLPGQYASILLATRRFDPDLIFGMGAYAAHAGVMSRTPTVLLLDSEPTTLDHAISRPFADTILTPAAFRKDLGDNHYVFDGFKETAYLHPRTFVPDRTVRDDLGVGAEDYAIVRFNAFGSHHDVNRSGFTQAQRRDLIERLAEVTTVVVSDEGGDFDLGPLPARPFDLHPAQLHDALAEASLLVADTQTMVTEAALLGTPAIRSNSFVGEGDMGNFLELEEHGLIFNLQSFEDVWTTARELFTTDGIDDSWHQRRTEYLASKVNLTDVIVDVATAGGDASATEALSRWGSTELSDDYPADGVSESDEREIPT